MKNAIEKIPYLLMVSGIIMLATLGYKKIHKDLHPGPDTVVRQYLDAPTWQDRVELVRNPNLVRRLMEQYYSGGHNWDDPQKYKIEKVKENPDGTIALFMITAESDGKTSAVLAMKENGFWKIDWPLTVNYNPFTSVAYEAQRPLEHYNMRVLAKLSDYYNFDFMNGQSKYYSIQITGIDGKSMPYGYIEKKSDSGKQLFELLKDGEDHGVILKMSYLPGSTGDVVLIHKVVSYNGQDDEPKLIDQVNRSLASTNSDPLLTSMDADYLAGCKMGAHESDVYKMCKGGWGYDAVSMCSCEYLQDQTKLTSFCLKVKGTLKASDQICLENSDSKIEYALCMKTPIAIHTKEEFDKVYADCKVQNKNN